MADVQHVDIALFNGKENSINVWWPAVMQFPYFKQEQVAFGRHLATFRHLGQRVDRLVQLEEPSQTRVSRMLLHQLIEYFRRISLGVWCRYNVKTHASRVVRSGIRKLAGSAQT